MLPNSRREIASIRWNLSKQLDYSRQALRDYISAARSPIKLRKKFPPIVKEVALGIHVRMCRRLRQAIMLAEAGQAEGSEILCRSIFEIFLAQAFVCRQSVSLKRINGDRVNLHGKKLTQEFRATLFLLHDLIQQEKRIENMEKVRRLKTRARAERKAAKHAIDSTKNHLGSGWAKALRANTCGGIPISDFAYSFGHAAYMYYRTIYSFHSDHVHPGEPERFLTHVDSNAMPSVKWHDGLHEVERSIWCAVAASGFAMNEFARLLDKENQRYQRLKLFENTYPEMKQLFRRITS